MALGRFLEFGNNNIAAAMSDLDEALQNAERGF